MWYFNKVRIRKSILRFIKMLSSFIIDKLSTVIKLCMSGKDKRFHKLKAVNKQVSHEVISGNSVNKVGSFK